MKTINSSIHNAAFGCKKGTIYAVTNKSGTRYYFPNDIQICVTKIYINFDIDFSGRDVL